MNRISAGRAALLPLMGLLAGAPLAAEEANPPPSATAAPPAAEAPPAGSLLAGRPDSEHARGLAPVAHPPVPTAADKLPVAKIRVPQGFRVEVFASGIPNARSLREGDRGTVFVGSRTMGKVHAVVSRDGRREVKVIAEGLHRPNGLAFHKGALYVAEVSKVSRYDDIERNLDRPQATAVLDNLPKDEAHGWKFIGIGPDEKLYVPIGAPCNICLPNQDSHAQIMRVNLDGSGRELVARGVRNTVGFDWHPVTKQLYFTDNGRDWMSEDVPHDELNRVTRTGEHFGFPFCHQGNLRDSEFGWGSKCEDFVRPIALLGPHTAALGMRFYTGTMFPAKYRNAIFVARHGSWNRTDKIGADVLVVTLDERGNVRTIEPFLSGLIENSTYLGRPVDMHVMKDGSLLVSDDFNGAIYRVSYGAASRR